MATVENIGKVAQQQDGMSLEAFAEALRTQPEGFFMPSSDPSGGPVFTVAEINPKSPIIYNSGPVSLVYDIETQSYWARVVDQVSFWIRVHQTPKTTVTKKEAMNFLKSCKNWEKVVEEGPKMFPGIPGPKSKLLKPAIMYYNALHNSITVKRDSEDTNVVKFILDKVAKIGAYGIVNEVLFLRPEFVYPCPCLQLQTYGLVAYCPACTIFRIQRQDPQTAAVGWVTLARVGKIAVDWRLAEELVRATCCDATTRKFSVENTWSMCNAVFHLANLEAVPIPKYIMLGYILRDSLFTIKGNGTRVSWIEYFKVSQNSFGVSAGDALLLVRVALAIGTLGAIS